MAKVLKKITFTLLTISILGLSCLVLPGDRGITQKGKKKPIERTPEKEKKKKNEDRGGDKKKEDRKKEKKPDEDGF